MDRDNAKGFGCGLLGNYQAAIRKTRRLARVRCHALALASFAFALAFSAPADAQFYPRWKHGWRPVEAAIVNRSNFTQVTPDGRVVAGPTDGAGTWETFRIFNQTDPDGELKYGDVVLIQAHTGRFLALGGGPNPLNPSVSSTATRREEALHFIVDALSAASMGRPVGTSHFRLRKAAMPDAFAPDRISPEAFYLSFDSIGAILARTTAAAAVVRLQSMDGEIVQVRRGRSGPTMTAEGGGGRELTVNRLEVGLWESFKLLNLSRPRQRPQVGDVIALQTTNGRFVGLPQPASAGAELAARIVRLTPAAHLEVVAISPDLAGLLQLALRPASASTGLFTSRGDRIVFTPEATQTALNLWTVTSSRDRPTEYRFLSEGGDLPATRPFATPPARVRGRRSVVVATYNVDPLPEGVEDISWVTEEVLRPGFVGEDGFSVATWLDDTTGGAVTISWGAHFHKRDPIPALPDNDEVRLAAVADAGVRGSRFAAGGLVDTTRTMLVRMTPSDGVGQQQSIDLRPGDPSRNPVREELRDFGICCDWFWIAAQNSSDDRWIATAAHESSHFFWGQWDRYGTPEAFRGEVVARLSEGVQPARIFVERVDGPGSVLVGNRVRLKERAGRYMGVGLERLWLRGKPPSPAVVDLVDGVAGATTFRIGSDDRPVGTPLASGDIIRLTYLDWETG